MADSVATPVEDEYPETPEGLARRYGDEISAAKPVMEKFWKRGEKIIKVFLDDRENSEDDDRGSTRLNLYNSNTTTLQALLFGKTPKIEVTRRYSDSEDHAARVAAEILERILNADLERSDDATVESLRGALQDRLMPGIGNVKLRYTATMKTMPGTPAITQPDPVTGEPIERAPAIPEQDVKTDEDVCTDYKFWRDQIWSPCKTFDELRWWAFGNDMSRAQLIQRFGEELGKQLPLSAAHKSNMGGEIDRSPVSRCRVWEIWSKERREVCWYVESWPVILDRKDDPLGLEGFWPFPRPMFANLTTSKLLPVSDYIPAQDLYEEINTVSTRITLLERAIRVVGVYDSNSDPIKGLISDTANNELIPVDNWAMFAEKGGVKGHIDWMPLDQIVAALGALREYQTEIIGLLFQVTGMSDIIRGQAASVATATEQAIKARFASVRVQSLQDEFARFCTETQRIKAEIIAKHFDPQTIIDRSNIMRTPDAQYAQAAVALIKSHLYEYRISVNPDSVSLPDMAALKQERFEFLTALSTFFQMAQPIVVMMPQAMPFMLQVASWALASIKGGSEMQGVFDQAAAQLNASIAAKAAEPPQLPLPDPKVEAAKIKAGAEQFKAHADVQSAALDMRAKVAQHQMDMQKLAVEHNTSMQAQEAQQRTLGLKAAQGLTSPNAPVTPAGVVGTMP